MKFALPFVIALFLGSALQAQEPPVAPQNSVFDTVDETDLAQFVWKKRPIVVFADNPADPRFADQIALLRARSDELALRDVVVLLDSDPSARSPLRLKLRPRGFMLVIMGKDGGVKLRKPFPWDVREITRSIDKMPMRKREIRDAKMAPTPTE